MTTADRLVIGRRMQAVVMGSFGAPEVLVVREMRIPEPGPAEVRVRVNAVVVNNTRDVLTRGGGHLFSRSVTLPHILGGEHAGEIDAVGVGLAPQLIGKRVVVSAALPCGTCEFCVNGHDESCMRAELIGVHRPGAYAEYAIAPMAHVMALPDDLSAAEAAVLLATGPVALAQLDAAAVGAGDVLVIPGVAGALGSMVAALAARRGVRVVGLTRDVEAAEAVPLAVDVLVDAAHGEALGPRLREACGQSGADAVVDNVCVPPIWDACLAILRPGGRVVISGQIGTGQVAIDPRRFYLSNHSILGVRTGNRAMQAAFWDEVRAGFRLPPGLVTTFPLAAAAAVHRLVEAGAKAGHFALIAGDCTFAPGVSATGHPPGTLRRD